jgi:hypothetical protein
MTIDFVYRVFIRMSSYFNTTISQELSTVRTCLVLLTIKYRNTLICIWEWPLSDSTWDNFWEREKIPIQLFLSLITFGKRIHCEMDQWIFLDS